MLLLAEEKINSGQSVSADNSATRTMLEKLKAHARQIIKELQALQIALTDYSVPWYAKAVIVLTVAYALSPIDLIPDFIPILGHLDDLIILPLLIYLAIKLIPPKTMEQCRQKAETKKFSEKKNWIAGGLIILFWLTVAFWVIIKLIN